MQEPAGSSTMPRAQTPDLRRRRPISETSPSTSRVERGTSPISVRVPHSPQPSSSSTDLPRRARQDPAMPPRAQVPLPVFGTQAASSAARPAFERSPFFRGGAPDLQPVPAPPSPVPREATSPGVQDPPLSRIPRIASSSPNVGRREAPTRVQPAGQPTPALQPERQQPPGAAEPRVIITPFGQCAHHISGCPSLANTRVTETRGLCQFCFPQQVYPRTPPTNPCRIFSTPQGNCIHIREDCRSLGGGDVHRRWLCQTCLPDGVQRG